MLIEHAVQSYGRSRENVFVAEEPGIVMQAKHQRKELKRNLVGVGVLAQLALVDGVLHAAGEVLAPTQVAGRHRVSQRARSIVILAGSGNEEAGAPGLLMQAEPVVRDRSQPGETAGLGQGGLQNMFDKAHAGEFQHRKLQVLTAAEVRKHPALGHTELLGELTQRQPLQAYLSGLLERRFQDRFARLLTLVHKSHNSTVVLLWQGQLLLMPISACESLGASFNEL